MVMKMMREWWVAQESNNGHLGPSHPKPFFVPTACLTILDHLPWCPLTPLWYQHCLTDPICKGWQPTKMKKPRHCLGIFYPTLTIHCDQSSQQRPIFQDKLEYSILEFQMFLVLRLLQSKIQAKTSHAILLLPHIKALMEIFATTQINVSPN